VAPAPARGPARDSLFRFDQARTDTAAARGPAEGYLALFAADVAYLRAGAPTVFGREAARVLLTTAPGRSPAMSWEPLGGGISDDLAAAYTYGVASRAASAAPSLERYIAYWERSNGQPWRIVAYVEVGAPPLTMGDVRLSAAQTAPPQRALPRALAQARGAVRAADSAFSDLSYRMGTSFAFSNTIADDGVLFGSPQLLVGPKAVREWYEARGQAASLTWTPVYAAVAGSRDLAYTIGEYVSTGRGPSGAAVQRVGKYLTVWRRENNGTWRFVADGGNPSPAHSSQR
jgi:ketosteroid isomerase-like protein